MKTLLMVNYLTMISRAISRQSPSDMIFNLNVNDVIYSPYGNFHNDSMLGIILLEHLMIISNYIGKVIQVCFIEIKLSPIYI